MGVCLCLFAVAVATAPAHATAPLTRDEYVKRAETICGVGVDRGGPLLETAIEQMQDNKVVSAGPKFVAAAAVFTGSRQRLTTLPRPAEDAAELSEWLRELQTQNRFLKQVGEALKVKKRVKAQGYMARFVHYGNLANNAVLGYGFKDCLFDNLVHH